MRKLWKILGDWTPLVAVVKSSDYEELLTEYDAKAADYEKLHDKYIELCDHTHEVAQESLERLQRAVVAEEETRAAEARYKQLWRKLIFLVIVVAVTAIWLVSRFEVSLANEGKTWHTQVFYQDGENTEYSPTASYPRALMKASCLDPATGKFTEIDGDTVFLEQGRDYLINIYIFYGAGQKFGNDIEMTLPAVTHKWQQELAELRMKFANNSVLPLNDLRLVATDDVVQVNKTHLSVDLVGTLVDNRVGVGAYLRSQGFTPPDGSGYIDAGDNLYHYLLHFSTEAPNHSYTYTTVWGSVVLEICFCFGVVFSVVSILYWLGSAIYSCVRKTHEDTEDDDDDYFNDEEDEEEPELDVIPCNREESSQ